MSVLELIRSTYNASVGKSIIVNLTPTADFNKKALINHATKIAQETYDSLHGLDGDTGEYGNLFEGCDKPRVIGTKLEVPINKDALNDVSRHYITSALQQGLRSLP
tara:strand:- start:7 stop:324 length:318 start_codon:yes stop_codon:yes gene_type:complete